MSESKIINNARRRLIKHIKKCVNPHLHKSGYIGNNGPLLLTTMKKVKLSSEDICCIVGEDWASIDGYAGGLCTTRLTN